MASVKWLTRIHATDQAFRGHFQVERYVIEGRPVREMEVRAVIINAGPASARGYAWTGRGSIVRVELSKDGGRGFFDAALLGSAGPYGWTEWAAEWPRRGTEDQVLIARATDSEGRVQPLQQRWNALGYANNQARPLTVAGP
jgi:hypothetical protein